MILVVTLLILLIALVLGSTLVAVSVTQDLAGSTRVDAKKAFSAAEAGISEAMYRMGLPTTLSTEASVACGPGADPIVVGQQGTRDVSWADPTNANFWHYNPSACSWTYSGASVAGAGNYVGGTAANLNSAGRTFTSPGGVHAAGAALAAANLTNGTTYTVTVAPVVGYVNGCWQYVNQLGIPLASCTVVANNPMYQVVSVGTSRKIQKTLVVMVQPFGINPTLDGAVTANASVSIQSAAARVDGHNFDCNGNNPSDNGSVKAVTVPSGGTVTVNKSQNLQCTAGNGVAKCAGTSTPFPSTIGAFLLGPGAQSTSVDAINAYLDSIKVTPANAPTSAFQGIVYIDGNYAEPPDGSSGILIVHNATSNATLGNFNGGTFKGLIIADQVQINGTAGIIGGLVTFAAATSGEGNPAIDYSTCTIQRSAQFFPGRLVPGTWHEG